GFSTILGLVGLAGGAPAIYRQLVRSAPDLKVDTCEIHDESGGVFRLTFRITNYRSFWHPPKIASFRKYTYAVYDSESRELIYNHSRDSSDILAPETRTLKS